MEFPHSDENRNPSLRYIALGESLSGPLLGNLEQIEDLNGHVLSKMRGKILGYNTWHYGSLDILDLGLETLAYVGDLVTLIDILSGVLEVYLKTLCCFFFVHVIVITFFVCNLEFAHIQLLLCPIFEKT